ncbi:MAG: PilZ domain-containing protein [Deltaproteobacteria bacterium]|nr:PilZ domain-containing protein [Deltaproteobacteria bacterium]
MSDEQERRNTDRLSVYMGAEITTPEGKVRSAITQDASPTGLLLLTRAKLEVGSKVTIRVYLPGEEEKFELVSASVVRREKLSIEESSLWREKVAVQLDDSVPVWVQEHFADISEKQAELFGRKKS